MATKNVREEVNNAIIQVAKEQNKTLPPIEGKMGIVDGLGFTSLEVATLISLLETNLGVDPFGSGDVSITDIRTVDELCNAYEKALK